jgi:hypothetical protein
MTLGARSQPTQNDPPLSDGEGTRATAQSQFPFSWWRRISGWFRSGRPPRGWVRCPKLRQGTAHSGSAQ